MLRVRPVECIVATGTHTVTGEVTSGKLSDGCSPRYDPDMYCRWIIKPTGAQYLSLNIQNLQLEQGWDFMNISDGNGVFLGTFTGSHNSSTPPVISSSGVLDITFYTDGYNHNFGWNMSTEIVRVAHLRFYCVTDCGLLAEIRFQCHMERALFRLH